MRRRDLLATTLAACALAGCNGNDEPAPPDPDPDESEEPEEGERVEIVESALIRENAGTEEETVSVGGIVVPHEDVEVSYVEVRASFYDEEGELLDTTIEQVNIDEETDRWEFEVTYPQMGEQAAEVVEYELEVGTEL